VYKADVADDAQVRAMVGETIEKMGRLDILVNNAGVTYFVDHADLEGLKAEYWDRIMAVNVRGMFFCCRAAAEELKKRKGCIINITSIAGLTGLGSSIAYAASKAAAISLTKSLARVMAPQVRVNSIAPGVMGRIATAEDVSEVAYALITQAGFVTGQSIVVDGGMFM
jgi:3-oxoacyl-[acyl-carrier protein] reductase